MLGKSGVKEELQGCKDKQIQRYPGGINHEVGLSADVVGDTGVRIPAASSQVASKFTLDSIFSV